MTEQPVAQRQVGRPAASTAQDNQLLREHEILRISARTPRGPHSFAARRIFDQCATASIDGGNSLSGTRCWP